MGELCVGIQCVLFALASFSPPSYQYQSSVAYLAFSHMSRMPSIWGSLLAEATMRPPLRRSMRSVEAFEPEDEQQLARD